MKRGNLGLLSAVAMFILFSGPLSRAAFLYVVNPHQAVVGFSIPTSQYLALVYQKNPNTFFPLIGSAVMDL
jgi:hypothetical protein